jgi:fumarate hydratase class II
VKAGLTIAEATRDLGYVERGDLTDDQLERALDVTTMTGRNAL